jgi:dimethylargininase
MKSIAACIKILCHSLLMRTAVTRPVPASLARCELTHLARVPIDIDRAVAQHQRYEETLRALGCAVRRVAAADDLPDSLFVEDAAIVLDELAIITRPGAPSRRPECEGVARIIADYRPLQTIVPPGTIDGGDVLRLGRTLYVGRSTRTNADGVLQLSTFVAPFGYSVVAVTTASCLHLKSAVTAVDSERVLCNPAWIDTRVLTRVDIIAVDAGEPHAANVLRVGDAIVCAAEHERTADRLQALGYQVCAVDVSELAKAEAGVTCCSVIIED